MTLSEYVRVIRKRWRFAGFVVLICVALAGAVSTVLPQRYVASTTSFVSISSSSGSSPDQLYQNSQYALNQVQSYPLIVTSPEVMQPVIDELGLDLSVRELESQVSATNPVNTVLLDISATSDSAKEATAIANSVSKNLALLVENLEGTPAADTPNGVDSFPVEVTTAIPATEPTSPASPQLPVILALGLLLGLALGAMLAVLRERSDTRLTSSADVAAVTGVPPLGIVHRDPQAKRDPLALTKDTSPAVEDLRSIRTGLRHADGDEAPRQVVVTAAGPAEGTSLFASNLAIVMAQAQVSVCLVLADLRTTRSPFYAGIEDRPGLADVIAGGADLDDVLISWDGGRLFVLPPGTAPQTRDLLGSFVTTALLDKLRVDFDLVIIEAPPLLEVTDAAVLGTLSDGVIVVVRHGRTHGQRLRTALNTLDTLDVAVLGTVLTDVPRRDS